MKNYDLYLTGTVGWSISAGYVQYILNKKKDQPVDVAICSLGGYVSTGLEIYEMFKAHGQVTCHFIGMSASAATFMAMGAQKVKMSKNALILIHNSMSYVSTWGELNKEQIDELVKKLQFQRSQLNTVDDVLAEIYAERSGRSIEDVRAKMKVAAWINATDAKSFGLVDEIFEAEQVKDKIQNNITNSMIMDMGLPALPKGFNPETGEENPTKGVIQKVVEMLTGLFREPSTDNTQNKMEKITKYGAILAVLAIEGLQGDEKGNVTLTPEQLNKLNEQLRSQSNACSLATEKIKTQKTEIDSLKTDIQAKDEKIRNLEGSAGKKNEEDVDDSNIINNTLELFNSVNI